MLTKKIRHRCLAALLGVSMISGCSLPGLGGGGGDESVTIGTQDTSESQIIGHMLRIMIERNTDADVEIINNLGTSIVVHQAMMNGDINISSTRYTGTDIAGALNEEPIMDPDEALDHLMEEFDDRFDQTWFPSYGFDNTYAFTIREDLAEEEGIENVSDLEAMADTVEVGVDNNWLTREGDGYPAFQEHYGFEFDHITPMQIGLVYDALASGNMDVVLAYTSDGRIAAYDLFLLEDDQQFFPPYDTSAVATNDVLEANPGVEEAIRQLEGQISTEDMQVLNYEADAELSEPATVAENFLEENNYFE
ncbi:osmoprotectant transport system substrate-binding protein [Geomicrobium halophilum]|uniref:Osmoprotectant transport system substrate-binding protein n=1 Tax=Geomicrobium halophilum TaxID=549000 RepID=A0A841PYB9_9BACL|nr:osmoprotectant ABC transporter substrate-binding protein [Geomicrobium halophilum]MBB6449135.1 osmoprotectant transport system substrate-binding protein [Geomicrobium halophilum]